MEEKGMVLQPSERILMEELWKESPQTITRLRNVMLSTAQKRKISFPEYIMALSA